MVLIITVDLLAQALKNTLGRRGVSDENIKNLAEYVLNFFGYSDEIIDNRLTPQDRDIFYMLEELGILSTKEEEEHIMRGKLWRVHYWVLRKDNIVRLAKMLIKEEEKENYSIYERISEDLWKRR
jgi:hypothetical protein